VENVITVPRGGLTWLNVAAASVFTFVVSLRHASNIRTQVPSLGSDACAMMSRSMLIDEPAMVSMR
jgi:hypothetical protein